jgi:hypothetical protein
MGWQSTLATIFEGTNFEFNANGEFYYSGPPAFGNLEYSVANAPGTDPYGNQYLDGSTYYTATTALQVFANELAYYSAPSQAGPWSTQKGAIAFATGTPGLNIYADQWTPPPPASPTLLNGWINTVGFVPFRYRFVASPPQCVQLIGTISATNATSATFFQLPASYTPRSVQGFPVGATGGVPAGGAPNLRCDTSGNLTIADAAAVPAADTYFIHGFISIDA